MESAPLNLAHFYERRAEKHLRRNRYDEAIKAMETAITYVEDAYKTVTIPKSMQVLDAEKWECSRKLKQINIRQSQHEGAKMNNPVPQLEPQPEPPESTTMSIHQAIKNFDAKYTSSTLGSLYAGKNDRGAARNNNAIQEESTNWMEELQSKDFPALAPLELPVFDLDFHSGYTYKERENK